MDANLIRHAFILNNNTRRRKNATKVKGGNRDVIERYDTHKGDTQVPDEWRHRNLRMHIRSKTLSSI